MGRSDDGNPTRAQDFALVLRTYDALGRTGGADAVTVTIDVLGIKDGTATRCACRTSIFHPTRRTFEAASREFIDDNRATSSGSLAFLSSSRITTLTVEGYANAAPRG